MKMMTMETLLRMEITLISIATLLVVQFSVKDHGRETTPDRRLFGWMTATVIAIMLVDGISWRLNGMPGVAVHITLWFTNLIYFILHLAPPLLFIIYALMRCEAPERSLRLHRRAAGLIYALWTAFCASTPWTGLVFRIDSANRYVRGSGFAWAAVLMYALLAYASAYTFRRRRELGRRQWLSLILYPLPAAFGATVQNLLYGTVLVWPATVISLLIVAINMQNAQMGTDTLTGVRNRLSMMRYLHSLERSPDRRRIAGIAMDLDGFKSINDRFGHQTGDRALEEAAHIIRDSIRRNDFLARMGGDEFTVILETDNIAVVNEVVDRIRSNFERARTSPDRPYELAISIGWGVYDRAKDLEIGAFLSRIDTALYDDKRLHGATAC